MKIDLQAHVLHTLAVGETRSFLNFTLATKARRGEVVGVAQDVRLENAQVIDLPSRGVYGRTPDGIIRYPLAEVGPRWADQTQVAAAWARADPALQRLAKAAGRVLGDRVIEVIALRDALVLTTLRAVPDVAGPDDLELAQTVRQTTVVVLPSGLTLTGAIHALGGAGHVIGERLWRLARGLPEGPIRQACRRARIVVLPPAQDRQGHRAAG
ncbi:hypothetical protein Rumeso_00878 [Rubellimicrobium mesophilum DSM 19309]|uniref:Uncharacterized protein n=1 Tax=Rubellimicrobium mesophilum DSM 19309 TaxID=442562 RepID=A0A017HTA6_9RHOB|nr:hypothetical protein [Rubellimicrobium mesophilum]EYD77530.1 hypothetical protein Rumeso_00878 [Rubellimicrobium mesophilum DSM 19309]